MKKGRLIVLRGPSGAGKSTISLKLRETLSNPTALIEQDYIRRHLLGDQKVKKSVCAGLIKHIILNVLEGGYDVIADGIMAKKNYESVFQEIIEIHPEDNHFFYFDISFEETLKRHDTKPIADEFDEEDMRGWYKEDDKFDYIEEKLISETSTIEESLKFIVKNISA